MDVFIELLRQLVLSRVFFVSDGKPLLFIGHADVSCEHVICKLEGSSCVSEVRLNASPLPPLVQV